MGLVTAIWIGLDAHRISLVDILNVVGFGEVVFADDAYGGFYFKMRDFVADYDELNIVGWYCCETGVLEIMELFLT